MNKIKAFIEAEAVLLVAVLLAAFTSIGGTALVLGAVPDDNGQIHACRSNDTGAVRIIDTESESCTGSETEIDWSQNSGAAPLQDADGQFIGNIIDSRNGSGSPLVVYNPALKRIVTINYSDAGHYAIIPAGSGTYFESDNCTGQAYTFDDPHVGLKTELIRTGDSSYAIVQDNASPQTITAGSLAQYDFSTDSFSCNDITNDTEPFYQLTSVSIPFTVPVTGPFKF